MKIILTSLLISCMTLYSYSQSDYFIDIENTPDQLTSENLLKRMVDGLGFRYYWATESLIAKDLEFKPSEDARSTFETLEHLYGLSYMIKTSIEGEVFDRSKRKVVDNWDEMRNETLKNLEEASKHMKSQNIDAIEIKFTNGNTLPIWNLINGPISDAIYHTGQIVSFRRSSGNPVNPNVSVLLGTIRED